MIELPPKYYHKNFEYLLDFVKSKYSTLLIESEWRFLRKYYSLPEDAQCLYIRLINRKGLFFKAQSLEYSEISDLKRQLDNLQERGFVTSLSFDKHHLWLNEILQTVTKQDLQKTFDLKGISSQKKEHLITQLKTQFSAQEIIEALGSASQLIKVDFETEVSFLKFLFFGNKSMDMSEFVLRDLGLVSYYKQNDDDLVARFTSRQEAEDKWLVSEQFQVFSEIKEVHPPEEIFDWYCNFSEGHRQLSPIAIPSFQKLQLLIGKHLEKHKLYLQAIAVYDDAQVPPARERKARCLVKAKFFDEARATCEEMLIKPQTVDEQYFAEYFHATLLGKKNKKSTTEWLNAADEIVLPEDFRYQVELGSLAYFINEGYEGSFSENFPWRAIFGLLFWDLLFDPSLVAFHHPFQRRPSDLYLPEFFEKRKERIEELLAQIEDNDDLVMKLWKSYETHQGTVNPFVVWEPEVWRMVKILASRVALEALKKILLLMAENLVENSRGMPDLLLWNDTEYKLVEIKSPHDTLSNQQLFWLKTFKNLGIPASVLRVRFRTSA